MTECRRLLGSKMGYWACRGYSYSFLCFSYIGLMSICRAEWMNGLQNVKWNVSGFSAVLGRRADRSAYSDLPLFAVLQTLDCKMERYEYGFSIESAAYRRLISGLLQRKRLPLAVSKVAFCGLMPYLLLHVFLHSAVFI